MFVIIVASLMLLSPLARLPVTAQVGPNIPPPNQNPSYLWCLFCRSDKDPACINKAGAMADEFTRECTNDTLKNFYKDLAIDPPRRPIISPRAGPDIKWACYRMYTTDESFTIRSCIQTGDDLPVDEVCTPCKFENGPARCCICAYPNCNDKNSRANRHFGDNSFAATFTNSIIICGLTLLFA